MPVIEPTTAFIDAQRFGNILVQAQFQVFIKGRPFGLPYYAAASTGSFTIDRNSEFRRTGQITIEVIPTVPPPELMPVNPGSLLAPFGNEINVATGIATSAGTGTENQVASPTTWVPQGLYAITTSTVDDTGIDCTVTLDLSDRSWTIAQRALKNPYNFPATPSGNFVAEMQALLNMIWNQQVGVAPLLFNMVPTTAIVPSASYNQGSDPWQAAQDMASAVGYELYFDINGVVTARPIPNPFATAPCWNFSDDQTLVIGAGGSGSTALLGSPYSTPVEVSVVMTRDGIYNDVVIQGTGDANAATYNGTGIETSGPPILAEAADTRPGSPTYIGGGMGDVPNFVTSSLITPDGAQDTADTDLNQALSQSWQVTLTTAPNGIFDVDDTVLVTRPRVGLNNALVVLDTITNTLNYADTDQVTGRILTNQAA
jgi:hypothetical protein